MTDELRAWTRALGAFERGGLRAILGTRFAADLLSTQRHAEIDGRTLDKEMAVLLRLDDFAGRSDLRKLSPVKARARVAEEILVVDAKPPPGVDHRDFDAPGPAGPIRIRAYIPAGLAPPCPAVVYLHGGGWVTGSIGTHDGLCRRLAVELQARVFSVEYRLAPEHRFPAAVEDSVAAFRHIARSGKELGFDPMRIAVAGDSAGGNLSAVVAAHTSRDALPPRLAVLLYPALDMTARMRSHESVGDRYFLTLEMIEWYCAHYMGTADRSTPDASPLLAKSLPSVRTLVFTSGFDPLRDEGKAYADKLSASGTAVQYREFSHMVHGFALMTTVPSARRALDEVVAALRIEL